MADDPVVREAIAARERLRRAALAERDRLNLTNTQVAAICGCSFQTIRLLERGTLPKERRTILGIARFLEQAKRAKRPSDLRLPDLGGA